MPISTARRSSTSARHLLREAALRLGIRPIASDGRAVSDAVDALTSKHLTSADPAPRDWAVRLARAGHQDREPVRLIVEQDGGRRDVSIVPHRERPDRPLTRAAPVFGAPMAARLGALDERKLIHAGIVFPIPAERLSHVEGTPRESSMLCPVVVGTSDAGNDSELAAVVHLMAAAKTLVARCPR